MGIQGSSPTNTKRKLYYFVNFSTIQMGILYPSFRQIWATHILFNITRGNPWCHWKLPEALICPEATCNSTESWKGHSTFKKYLQCKKNCLEIIFFYFFFSLDGFLLVYTFCEMLDYFFFIRHFSNIRKSAFWGSKLFLIIRPETKNIYSYIESCKHLKKSWELRSWGKGMFFEWQLTFHWAYMHKKIARPQIATTLILNILYQVGKWIYQNLDFGTSVNIVVT